nr:MAG TPA: hypothetical protein [Caudoviricetes sp.]
MNFTRMILVSVMLLLTGNHCHNHLSTKDKI